MTGKFVQPSRLYGLSAVILTGVLLASIASADTYDVVFTIDSAASDFSYSGTNDVYGDYVPQSQGSDVTSVTGHFLVSFDPTTNTPTSMQLVGNDGYYQQTTPLALKTATPGIVFSYTGLSWDFSSPVLAGAGGSFSAATTDFAVSSGSRDATFSDSSTFSSPVAPYAATVTDGTWLLTELGAGTGDWQLTISGYYTTELGWKAPYGTGEHTFTLNATSNAHFGTGNIATLSPSDVAASVLGGSSTPGGVSINLPGVTNGGTFTAQQIPNPSGLSQSAITAAQSNPVFAASTSDLSANPQIWTVDYTGLQEGQTATLVFRYDATLLPAGFDETQLGIWHFNGTGWDFGGTVNPTDHTIAFETSNFSPFQLGVIVPEPSTVALTGIGMLALFVCGWRPRKKVATIRVPPGLAPCVLCARPHCAAMAPVVAR